MKVNLHLSIDSELINLAKGKVSEEKQTLSGLFEDFLRSYLFETIEISEEEKLQEELKNAKEERSKAMSKVANIKTKLETIEKKKIEAESWRAGKTVMKKE